MTHVSSHGKRIGSVSLTICLPDLRAIGSGNECTQADTPPRYFREARDRRLTRSIKCGEKGTLNGDTYGAVLIVDRCEHVARTLVIVANFDADSALCDRRQHDFRRYHLCCGALHPKPFQAGKGKESGVGMTRLDLIDPCSDIAAKRHDF